MNPDHLAHAVRQRLVRLPEPYASHFGVVPAPPPEHRLDLTSIASRHEQAVAAISRIDTLAQAVANPFLFGRLLTRQEAVSSSLIEGTESTLDELLSIEETGDEKTNQDAKQVRDYASAVERFVEQASRNGAAIFTVDLVKSLHLCVMREDKSYRDVPGELRTSVVWVGNGPIGTSSWNAPPPEDVSTCLEQSVSYMRKEAPRLAQSLVERMAIAHAHFEAVHPFRDGNGRVGRILLALAMAAEGHVPLYLSPYIEAHRGGYFGALRKATQQLDWIAIIRFFCDAFVETAAHLEDSVKMLRELQEAWLRRKAFRKSSGALRALDVLMSYPVVTTRRLASELGVSFGQASDALAQLAAIGVVTERTGYRRNRIFVAEEVLAIVGRPYEV